MQKMGESNWRQRVTAATEIEEYFISLNQNFTTIFPYLP
jgi:hypothetical protein